LQLARPAENQVVFVGPAAQYLGGYAQLFSQPTGPDFQNVSRKRLFGGLPQVAPGHVTKVMGVPLLQRRVIDAERFSGFGYRSVGQHCRHDDFLRRDWQLRPTVCAAHWITLTSFWKT